MGTITIHSNKADDLYFINELARRMNLKTEIDTPPAESTIGKMEPAIDYETPEGIVASVKRGLQYIKEREAGLHKQKTLLELINEED